MSLFRRAAPAAPARVDDVALLVASHGESWRVASGYADEWDGRGGAPSWSAECADGDLEATLATGLAAAFDAAARPHVDSDRWFAGDLRAAATQPALEDAALGGARFFTVTLGPRGCVAVRYLLGWPLSTSRDRDPLVPGTPDNGTAAFFDRYLGWGPGDFVTGRYAEPLDQVTDWLHAARRGDPRLAAFYAQSVTDPTLPLLPLLPEFAKTTVTSLLGDSDALVDESGPGRLDLPDPGVTGRWRMLLHWDPFREADNRDAVAGYLGIVVTGEESIRWLYWPSRDPEPQLLVYRGRSIWSMAQRQIAVRMIRELVAAGGIPDGWERQEVR